MRTAFKSIALAFCLLVVALIVPARAQTEDTKKNSSDWLYYILGGGIVYWLLHHPHTQERPTPLPSPVEPTPTPQPRVTPNIYGHDEYAPCRPKLDDGAFEAIQGPYQDDPVFKNKPDRLRREDGSPISYYGELDMVQNRPSTLAGVDAYVKNGQLVQIGMRDYLFMRGEQNCRDAGYVKMRFWLYEGGTRRLIYTSEPEGPIRLFGPRNDTGQFYPWQVKVPAFDGQPEGAPFYFRRPADFYAIKAELIDLKGNDLGFSIWVNGYVAQTAGPLTQLQPVILTVTKSRTSAEDKGKVLLGDAARLQAELYENVPDVYPLAPFGLPQPRIGDPLDLSDAGVLDSSWKDTFQADVFVERRHKDNLNAAIADRLGATAAMQGVARTIALLTDGDMNALSGRSTLGITLSTKVQIVRGTEPWTTPAHELAHSLPEYIWSSPGMRSECELDYHNKGDAVSYGIQLTQKSVVSAPKRHFGQPPDLMGDAEDTAWDGQCTYAHLLDGLQHIVDPQVQLVRFGLVRHPSGTVSGKLLPEYEVTANLTPVHKSGHYAILALDAAGHTVLDRPFDPPWINENGVLTPILALQQHIPIRSEVARIELRGPSGVLDALQMSSTAPSVTIDRATIAGRDLRVRWHGSGERGKTLRYSVLVSADNGVTFKDRIFEQRSPSAVIRLYERTPLIVRVIVTDGSRSAQTQIAAR